MSFANYLDNGSKRPFNTNGGGDYFIDDLKVTKVECENPLAPIALNGVGMSGDGTAVVGAMAAVETATLYSNDGTKVADLGAGVCDFKQNPTLNGVPIGGGGGGSMNNPSTADLDMNGFKIFNVPNVNDTEAPTYVNYGAVAPGDYGFAVIPNAAQAEGEITFHIRCLDTGLKQDIFFNVIGYSNKGIINVINHNTESDTMIFNSITYGQDAGGQNWIVLSCGTPSATCEFSVFQNQGNDGTGVYGEPFQPVVASINVPLPLVFTNYALIPNSIGTTGSTQIEGDFTTEGRITGASYSGTGTDILMLKNVNMNNNNITNANVVYANSVDTTNIVNSTTNVVNVLSNVDIQNNQLFNSLNDYVELGDNIRMNTHGITGITSLEGQGANDISVVSNLDMNQNDLNDVQNLRVDNLREATAANSIVVHNTLNMNNNHIHNLADPTQNKDGANKDYVDNAIAGITGFVQNPMTSNLDGGGFLINNLLGVTADTIQNTAGNNMFSNGAFTHGGGSSTTFQVGGTETTFAPSTALNIKNFGLSTTFVEFTQSDDTLRILNGAKIAFDNGGVSVNGKLIAPRTSGLIATPEDQQLELCEFNNGANTGNIGFVVGNNNFTGTLGTSLVGNYARSTQFFIENVGSATGAGAVPFTGTNTWDDTQNGQIIRMYQMTADAVFGTGTLGSNNVGVSRGVYGGVLTGCDLHSEAPWTFSGGANLTLLLGGGSIGSPFTNIHTFALALAQAQYKYFSSGSSWDFGNRIEVQLNIPPGGSISTGGWNTLQGYTHAQLSIPYN